MIKGTTYYMEVFVVDNKGDPVTGLTIAYSIYNSNTDVSIDSGSLIEVGEGVYKKQYTFNDMGQFRIVYTTPSKYNDSMETVLVEDDNIALLKRILGMSQENYRILNPTYVDINGQSCMTACTIKIYPSAVDVDANINEIATYQVTSSYNSEAEMISYKVKKV